METKEKIERLMESAIDCELEGVELFSRHGFSVIRESYNGIGPEFFSPAVREKVTQFLALFEPAALIHDVRNEFSDGTRYSFNLANYEFLANCERLADEAYAWWRPRRYIARSVARILFDFVSGAPGWRAWKEAKERHEKKMNQNGGMK